MYISIKPESRIISLDYSLSTTDKKTVTVFTNDMHSLIVIPQFINALTLFSGLFDLETIREFITGKMGLSSKQVDSIIDNFKEWNIIEEKNKRSYWGNEVSVRTSFSDYRIVFDNVANCIDIAVLLSKYDFHSFCFDDIIISDSEVDTSLFLTDADIGKSFKEILSNNYGVDSLDTGDSCDKKTIFVGHQLSEEDKELIWIDINDYKNTKKICENQFFDFHADTYQEPSIKNFRTSFLAENEIVFGVLNGFYD